MRSGMKKSNLKNLLLIAFSLNLLSCDKTLIKPHVLDTQLMELREYQVIDPINLIIEYKGSHPITPNKDSYGNGYWCFSPQDMAEIKKEALKCKEKNGN